MKVTVVVSLLFSLTIPAYSQTKSDINKLNSFLRKWSYSRNPTTVIEATRQILVPWAEFDDAESPITFGSISWNELDSIVIYDLAVSMPYLYFYGRAKGYRACEDNEKCKEVFYKSKYREERQVDFIEGRLQTETEKGEQLSKENRQEILKIFQRLIIKK